MNMTKGALILSLSFLLAACSSIPGDAANLLI